MLDRIKEDAGRSLSDFTDQDHSKRTYYRLIAAGLGINVFSWIVALITPEAIAEWVGFVADISDKVKAYLLAFPFWSTFLALFAALRIRTYSPVTAVIADDDLMASYRDSERSNYLRNRILLALAGAAVNTIILVFVVLTLR
jgi:hypothetical protein